MTLRFVTGNAGKFREAQALLAARDIPLERADVPTLEIQSDDLEEVAALKALQLLGTVRPPYFLEDAGLFVGSLAGFPGPYSSHAYRTIGCGGILRLLRGRTGAARAAHFEAVVAYVDPRGSLHLFLGVARGRIADRPRGRNGFGFDPIFLPRASRRTFAEMTAADKNRISHRGRAVAALVRHLRLRPAPTKRVKRHHPVPRPRAP